MTLKAAMMNKISVGRVQWARKFHVTAAGRGRHHRLKRTLCPVQTAPAGGNNNNANCT